MTTKKPKITVGGINNNKYSLMPIGQQLPFVQQPFGVIHTTSYLLDEDIEYFYQTIEFLRKFMKSMGLETNGIDLRINNEKCNAILDINLFKKPKDADSFVNKMKKAFMKGAIDERNSDKDSDKE